VHVGDSIMCEGPIGKLKYLGYGEFIMQKKPLKHKKNKIGLLAAGSGITPMYAIAQASALGQDGAEVKLIFSNKTKDDILCKDYLDLLEQFCPNVKIFHTLTRHKPEEHGEWNGLTGRVNMDMLKQCGFAEPADDVFIAICGTSSFKTDI